MRKLKSGECLGSDARVAFAVVQHRLKCRDWECDSTRSPRRFPKDPADGREGDPGPQLFSRSALRFSLARLLVGDQKPKPTRCASGFGHAQP
jgi:hypothetical protein